MWNSLARFVTGFLRVTRGRSGRAGRAIHFLWERIFIFRRGPEICRGDASPRAVAAPWRAFAPDL